MVSCTQLEYVSAPGFLFVLMLLITVAVEACTSGLPAIHNGVFQIIGFQSICKLLPSFM